MAKNLPGASYNSRAARWQARIAVEGVRTHLGYYDSEAEASEAYSAAKAALVGERAAQAVRDRPAGPRRPQVAGAGQQPCVAPSVAALLLPAWLLHSDEDPFSRGRLDEACIASRDENVSLQTVCELLGLQGVEPGVEGYRVAIRRLRGLGLLHRVGEVSLVADRERTSFEGAIAIVGAGAGEDFV